MKKYRVISDGELTHAGKVFAPGSEFEADPTAGHVLLWIKFKQIEEVKEKASKEEKAAAKEAAK